MKKLLFVFFLALFVLQGCGFEPLNTTTLGKKSKALASIPASYHGVWTGSGSCNQTSYNLKVTISDNFLGYEDNWPALGLTCKRSVILFDVSPLGILYKTELIPSESDSGCTPSYFLPEPIKFLPTGALITHSLCGSSQVTTLQNTLE